MSSVRMCDMCGTVFSERAEGWSTFTGSTRRKNDQGQWVNVTDTLDSCPEDTERMRMASQPIALPTTASPRYESDAK
jgi:hypothetical protein